MSNQRHKPLMKNVLRKRTHGRAFTLIELLVVIGIIAILAGVVSVSVGAAIKFAKRTKSQAVATSIQTAVQNYYTEYGIYPTQAGYPGAGDAYYDGTTASKAGWQNLIAALCGNVNPATGVALTGAPAVTNARGIPFLAPSRGDLEAVTGIPVNPFGAAGTTGSTYFYLAMDTDYTGIVGDNGDAAGKIPNFTQSTNVMANPKQAVTGGVVVWCPNDQNVSGGTSASSGWTHTY